MDEVEAFYEKYPELREERFEPSMREQRFVNGENQTTVPIDPHELAWQNLPSLFLTNGQRTPEQEDLHIMVWEAFRKLPAIDVAVLQRRHMEQMTLDAIAAEDGVTRQAIIKRLSRAESHLREVLRGV